MQRQHPLFVALICVLLFPVTGTAKLIKLSQNSQYPTVMTPDEMSKALSKDRERQEKENAQKMEMPAANTLPPEIKPAPEPVAPPPEMITPEPKTEAPLDAGTPNPAPPSNPAPAAPASDKNNWNIQY